MAWVQPFPHWPKTTSKNWVVNWLEHRRNSTITYVFYMPVWGLSSYQWPWGLLFFFVCGTQVWNFHANASQILAPSKQRKSAYSIRNHHRKGAKRRPCPRGWYFWCEQITELSKKPEVIIIEVVVTGLKMASLVFDANEVLFDRDGYGRRYHGWNEPFFRTLRLPGLWLTVPVNPCLFI